jgi:hypothetical protein
MVGHQKTHPVRRLFWPSPGSLGAWKLRRRDLETICLYPLFCLTFRLRSSSSRSPCQRSTEPRSHPLVGGGRPCRSFPVPAACRLQLAAFLRPGPLFSKTFRLRSSSSGSFRGAKPPPFRTICRTIPSGPRKGWRPRSAPGYRRPAPDFFIATSLSPTATFVERRTVGGRDGDGFRSAGRGSNRQGPEVVVFSCRDGTICGCMSDCKPSLCGQFTRRGL